MSVTLVASNPTVPPSPQWAHDIRNALAIASLHLETLEQLSGPAGRKAATAAHATLARAAALCQASRQEATRLRRPRGASDLMVILREIAALLGGVAPAHLAIHIPAEAQCFVRAEVTDLHRMLVNLMQNAVTAARQGAPMSELRVSLVRTDATIEVTIADDGPGLPAAVRRTLFRPTTSGTGGSGLGIAIARELAERNGARLTFDAGARGTCYRLELVRAGTLAEAV